MIPQNELAQDIKIRTVGSSLFGRYPKVSLEKTFNMIMTDENWLVDYAGYFNVLGQNEELGPNPLNPNGVGRGEYHSTKLNRVFACVFNGIYSITDALTFTQIGTIDTINGDVFFAEDTQGHIAICDKKDIWIFTEAGGPGAFVKATLDGTNPLDFRPGYVAYQNGRFISVDLDSSSWRLSNPSADNKTFPFASQYVGEFQTKADIPLVVVPMPGSGSNILIMGSIVGEFWSDVGAALFPYQKSQGVNLDYGTLNADTIAINKDIVCWLAGNDRSGPFIAYSTGGAPKQISTDGIDFFLSSISTPTDAHGFFFKQDGHLIYQLTFPTDNASLIYDFNTQKFFNVSDENMNYHPAKNAVYFNDTYYFISLNDGNFYEFDTSITTYNYGYNAAGEYIEKEIPRIRICDTLRQADGSNTIFNALAIPFEMGTQPDPGMSVVDIILTDAGTGYTSAPTITLLGGYGQGATASISEDDFELLEGVSFLLLDGSTFVLLSDQDHDTITVDNPGANYSFPPDVIITGGGGTGMAATAVLSVNTLPRMDIRVSRNGGMTFGNFVSVNFNTEGHYKNRFTYFGLGMANEFTLELRFWSKGRFVMGQGLVSAYQ